jgi:hypothetical protein
MHTRNYQNFKGEIEVYLKNGQNVYDSKIDSVFQSLKFKTGSAGQTLKSKKGITLRVSCSHCFCCPYCNSRPSILSAENSGNSGRDVERTPITGSNRMPVTGGEHL